MSEATSPSLQGMVRSALGHHQAGRLAEAARMYGQVLAINPNHADGLHLLGMVAYQTGDYERAVELICRAIGIHATAASYHSNLGNALHAQGKLDEARTSYGRALTISPHQAEIHLNLGHIFRAQGAVDSALASYRRALEVKPELAEACVAESMTLLLQGDFINGWRNFETRWRTQDYDTPPRTYPQPFWQGEPIANGRVLIWGEQGVGDEIMFAGLTPDVLAAGHRCVLDCDARLEPLFSRSFPDIEIVTSYDPSRFPQLDIAAHIPSGSLPRLFRSSFEAFAASKSPYLAADPVKRQRLRAAYDDGRPLVGLAWHTKNPKSGRQRSIDLSLLSELTQRDDVRWVSLQYGDHDELEHQASVSEAPLLIDRGVDQLSDLDGFAAQVAAMDLVVTIDNSAAHLAAALGVPTWLLLPFAPDWRWLLAREDSPWYPAMRLFRQPKLDDWKSVLLQVDAALGTRFGMRSGS